MIFNQALTVSLSQLRTAWIPVLQTCAETDLPKSKLNLIVITASDISLLLIMLVGLFRFRGDGIDIGKVLPR